MLQAVTKNGKLNAEPSRPFRKMECFSVECDFPRASHVASLFFSGRPAAIFWRIVAIVVWVSVQGMLSTWSFAHVGEKVCERVAPSLADFNPAPAVVIEVWRFRIVASGLHALPNMVFGYFSHRDLFALARESAFISGNCSFRMKAAATLGIPAHEVSSSKMFGNRAAFATASPNSLSAQPARKLAKDFPSAKKLAGDVYAVIGVLGRMLDSHDPLTSFKGRIVVRAGQRDNAVRLAHFTTNHGGCNA